MLNYKLVLCLIGISLSVPVINGQTRLFGGRIDVLDNYLYHVAVLQLHSNNTAHIVCGGAIIHRSYVLTAAHCVYGLQKNEILVRSGWDVAPSQPHEEKRSYHRVTKVMYPKEYFHSYCRHHEHDIAILKLDKIFDLAKDSQFKKVSLPHVDSDYDGYNVTFTGFGIYKIRKYKNYQNEIIKEVPLYPNELRYINTLAISNEECSRIASAVVTKTNMCTQPVNSAGFSCLGDDGGPLVYDGVIIGIRNSHNNVCDQGVPEIFTRVSSYLTFIKKVLNQQFSYNIVYI